MIIWRDKMNSDDYEELQKRLKVIIAKFQSMRQEEIYKNFITSASSTDSFLPDISYQYLQGNKDELEKTNDWKGIQKKYLEHVKWRFSYPQTIFRRQEISSWGITILVFALITSGLFFSLKQLSYAMSVGDLSTLATDISIETAGRISISSTITGAIVLFLSLGFFYLYIRYIFYNKYPVPPTVPIDFDELSKVKDIEKK